VSETAVAQQRVFPMLGYEDVGAAVDWLCEAFGYRESGERDTEDNGRVTHAEIELGGATPPAPRSCESPDLEGPPLESSSGA
jgi:uncharacterized glyoxalase superfamily protein PhnB